MVVNPKRSPLFVEVLPSKSTIPVRPREAGGAHQWDARFPGPRLVYFRTHFGDWHRRRVRPRPGVWSDFS